MAMDAAGEIAVEIIDEPAWPLRPVGTRRTAQNDIAWQVTLLVGALLVVLAAALLEVRSPRTVGIVGMAAPLPELCMWRQLFQQDCPGCGLTRSFVSLAHGDLRAGWNFHPVGTLMFALVAVQIPYRAAQIWRMRRGRPAWQAPWMVWCGWMLIPLLVAQWIWRVWA